MQRRRTHVFGFIWFLSRELCFFYCFKWTNFVQWFFYLSSVQKYMIYWSRLIIVFLFLTSNRTLSQNNQLGVFNKKKFSGEIITGRFLATRWRPQNIYFDYHSLAQVLIRKSIKFIMYKNLFMKQTNQWTIFRPFSIWNNCFPSELNHNVFNHITQSR